MEEDLPRAFLPYRFADLAEVKMSNQVANGTVVQRLKEKEMGHRDGSGNNEVDW